MKNKRFKKDWFSISLQGERPEILIYDEIGMFGSSAMEVVSQLDEISSGVTEIDVRLNTPGGDFFAGVTIYNALRSLSDEGIKINMWVDGVAASAGSLIAMAGDTIRIAENAFLMMHEPWSVAMGNAGAFRAAADRMDKLKEAVVLTYAGRSSNSIKEVTELLRVETWFGAEEAVEEGFADEIFNEAAPREAQLLTAKHDLSQFKHIPESLSIKGDNDIIKDKRRAYEGALRDAGASRAEAKAIIALALRDAGAGKREAQAKLQEEQNVIEGMDRCIAILTDS